MVVIVAAAVGLLVGPLLAVPAHRLSRPTGCQTACVKCERKLVWTRVLPAGRCPSCRTRLGPSPWLLSAGSALLCAGLAGALGPRIELVPLLLVVLLGVLLGAVDLAAERLPDVLVLPGLGASVAAYAAITAVAGEWETLGRSVAAGIVYAGGYFILALLPGAQLGLGDVKLAALLGVCLGWFGWPLVVAGALLPWLVNAPVALVLLIRRGAGSSMPFGPAMLAGAYLALVAVPPLARLVS